MSKRIRLLIARMVIVFGLAAIWIVVPVCGHAQVHGLKQPKASEEKGTSPAVKIEVKKKDGKEGAGVEVKVEGAESKDKTGDKKTASAKIVKKARQERLRDRVDQVYEAARKLSEKIDYAASKTASVFGQGSNKEVYAGIKLLKILVSLVVLLCFFALERLFNWLIGIRLNRVRDGDSGIVWRGFVLEALQKPLSLFLWVNGIYLALTPLYPHFEDPDGANLVYSIASGATNFSSNVAIIWFLYGLAVGIETRLQARAQASESRTDKVLASLLGRTLRTFVLVLGVVVVLQSLTGLEIAPLLASLGLGGFAVALAAKDSISNFFGTVTILLDKPFSVGDRVVIGEHDGLVESVGYRSTRIRTFEGGLVSIPNEKMIHAAVNNVGARPHIRWHTNIGLRYDTPPDKVEKAVEILQQILKDHEGMNEEHPPRVYFDGLKDGTLNIALFAWYHPPEYWDYMAWVQANCLAYLRSFNKEGIEIAIPSRMVYMGDGSTAEDT
jgi:MscS family membrane protein